jgi:hypothetical protein
VSEIVQSATRDTITFSATTQRAEKWLLDHYGSSPVTYRFANRKEMASDLRKKAKIAKFTIASL